MAKEVQVENVGVSNAPAAAPTAADPPAARAASLVHDWFVEHVQNTPIAQDQRAYAQALVAKDALVRMILERLF